MKKNYICPELNIFLVKSSRHLCSGSIGDAKGNAGINSVYGGDRDFGGGAHEADSRRGSLWDDED